MEVHYESIPRRFQPSVADGKKQKLRQSATKNKPDELGDSLWHCLLFNGIEHQG